MEVKRALRWALGSDGIPLLNDEQAQIRANAIARELPLTGFALKIKAWRNSTSSGELCAYPTYEIRDPRYDMNSVGPGEKGQFAINGPGLSEGDLLRLGRACEIMAAFFPCKWPKETRDQINDPQAHLDTIEEILWLGRFNGVQNVHPNVKQPNGKNVDWGFDACTQPVQIEVKNLRREYIGAVDPDFHSRAHASWYEALKGKFSRDHKGSLNIACVTTFLEPEAHLAERASELLKAPENIDAIIIWSYHSPTGKDLTLFAKSPEVRVLVEALLAPVSREDSHKFLLISHLTRCMGENRVATLPEILRQLGEENREIP